MKLIEFKSGNGYQVFINPEHVVKVIPWNSDHSIIYLIGNTEDRKVTESVLGTPHEVAEKLQA
ncbi:hypothetical protein VAE122_670003 [Vibrio aestuarianus]|uniref:hypothetical protein n=1 Tax=Vibrio aestuarianus TaxID=28171 RepID=UPI0021C4957A|nr:hypothetical protein [Vibrio aestuarianus]CAH8182161.1 hypothetical protein VAE128_290002 [Vibrio aestuarianus]CAH8242525.1 hypothetical protein VAE122_670003 [Vibrio aestuarianus]